MIEKPMRLQTADPRKIHCKDCIYRDQTTMNLDGEILRPGITRDTCLIFDGKRGRWKPNSVYFRNEPCAFYEKDMTAPRFWEDEEA